MIGLFDDDEEALGFARRISLATGLPVEDARDREHIDEDAEAEARENTEGDG